MFDNRTYFADIKVSEYIERDPYEHYMDLVERGAHVLIISRLDCIKFAQISMVELLPGWHRVWPVVNGWVSPRSHPDYASLKFNYNGNGSPYKGSGTDFRKFKTSNFLDWTKMNLCFELNNFHTT